MNKKVVLLLIVVGFGLKLMAQIPKFASPVEGEYMKDYFIINYVDRVATGIQDYNCGNKTYDAHKGTDFALISFPKMDSGVYAIAAEMGRVTKVIDTFYDRNKNLDISGPGNYIEVLHTNKYYSYYCHLRKNSALVKPGDLVTKGQRLGLIGSSGYSTDPHLHFEVWNDTIGYVDPFMGSCGNPTSMWVNQFAYDNAYRILDRGQIAVKPTIDTLRERYPSKQIFNLQDPVVCVWLLESGVVLGDSFSFKWYNPQGALWFTMKSVYSKSSSYYYNWSFIFFPKTGIAGMWHVKYFKKGVEIIDIPVTLQIGNSIAERPSEKPILLQSDKQISVSYPANFQIRYYDVRGKLMINNDHAQGSAITDVSEWPSGTYIMQLTSKETFYSKKFIVR